MSSRKMGLCLPRTRPRCLRSRVAGLRFASAGMTGLLSLASVSVALAATPVDLAPQPASHGASVTLGDLFDGATGAAAAVAVARAPAPGLQAVLDADRVQAAAHRAGLDWPNAQGVHRIIVVSLAGPASETTPARGARNSRRAAQALAYARNIMAGEILAASDLRWSDEAVAGPDSPSDPDLAIGKAARRPLREGAAVQASDLIAAKVVKRNETVTVAYQSDGVTLTLDGKALADGAVGDVIGVSNLQSKKTIDAVVVGPGKAVVGPAADALKAAAFDPTLKTASLP
jgi:flagellar basal body P-ring formation protein FlgA